MAEFEVKPFVILQTGDAPDVIRQQHGGFTDMFLQQGEINPASVVIVNLPAGEQLLSPEHYRGAIITGSAAMVTELLPWSEQAAVWLRDAVGMGLPIFGACYGHQLLAHALGGEVGYHPQGMEIGTLEIELLPEAKNDPALQYYPPRFYANLIHSQTVLRLPEGAVALARSAQDPHQIIRYRDNVMSTQFHPEFNGPVMHSYMSWIAELEPEHQTKYLDIQRRTSNTPVSQSLLREFVNGL
ncbi:glutamine amidotransferase [Hafnia paralvei]|jgi:GMP synthase (glutamine-hydrolysing)|uniref:glutamine amidotransferase n=1 Tax=Hafnia paralvei TaxID=546367 RepID=UPI001D0E5BE9|nr:glutamine amidotransferase [Hafnia paralvei]